MERTIKVTGRGAIHVVPDVTRLEVSIDSHFKSYQDAYDQAEVSSINYSHEDIHIYSQARNIHSAAEAKVSTAESLEITPEDLAISDDVTVEWVLVGQPIQGHPAL